MKSLLIPLMYVAILGTPAHEFLPCGARVPERQKENHQVQNCEIQDAAPPQVPVPRVDEKKEWKPDPTIENYEYYEKPNGSRVYRVKPCCMQHFNHPQVLNPEFV